MQKQKTVIQNTNSLTQGFTLLEILLVLVIIGSILTMAIGYYQQTMQAARNDRTAGQMQQILNAGMSYYVANGTWPPDLLCLQGDTSRSQCNQQYLPTNLTSGWEQQYKVASTTSNFFVTTPIIASTPASANANAEVIAGKLPLSYLSSNVSGAPPYPATPTCATPTCNVVASVNVPGQNLSNATAINFAGLYHQGACVPVPTCPVDRNGNTMTPQVIIVPVQVSGYYEDSNNVYPISSFTAYAKGGSNNNPVACDGSPTVTPTCTGGGGYPISGVAAAKYWRACLQLVTEKGDVQTTNNPRNSSWGGKVSMAAFTRCAVTNEASGSAFTVFGN